MKQGSYANFEEYPRCTFLDICVFVKPVFRKNCSNFGISIREGCGNHLEQKNGKFNLSMFDCRFAIFFSFFNIKFSVKLKNFTSAKINQTAPKTISSGVDNWYLDEFFEEFICGR
jgi:hypothetical protein